MKRKCTCLSIASASMILIGTPPEAQSATIMRVLNTQVRGSGEFDVLFDPVDDVSSLVTISDGAVSNDEGGTIQISAILSDNSLVQLFAPGQLNFGATETLVSITGNNFTALPSPVTVTGLRFTTVGGAVPSILPAVNLPAGTVLTFAVPEPSAALLSMVGLAMFAMRRRRA